MKKFNKLALLLTVCLISIALALVCLVACNNTEYFSVTADFDATQGSVVISNANGDVTKDFKSDEQAVVTVSANSGYSVNAFKVDGEDKELSNGKYTFNVTKNVVVSATFTKNTSPLAVALDSVKTTFKIQGGYVHTAENENPDVNNITTVFGNNAVNIVETNLDDEVIYDDVFVNKDGKLVVPYHTLENKIDYHYPQDNELFADYDNPFKALTEADFAATDEANVYALTDAAKRKIAATAITGYNESIKTFTITIANGKVTDVDIETERIKRGSGANEYYYTATYTMSVSEWGTAEVSKDKVSPYATTEAHTALANALEEAAKAKNYTIEVSETALSSIDADLIYNTYVTEKAIYYACEGWEEGYYEIGQGTATVVYPFKYHTDSETVTLYDGIKNFPTLRSMRASFNAFNDFAPEVFDYVTNEDGTVTYTLHSDVNSVDNVRSVLINFADGLDVIRLYAGYTYDMDITIKDGALYQVDMLYVVSDAYIYRTLTFFDFDKTELPIEINDDNTEHTSILTAYKGTYTNGTVTAVIDDNSIEIDGVEFEITDYSIQYDMFTGNWKGSEWYISKTSAKQLTMFSVEEETTYVLTSTEIDPVDIPDEFEGVWSVNTNTVAIAYDKIEYNGVMLKVLSYDEEDGLYATNGEVTYRFFIQTNKTDNTTKLLVIVYVDGLSSQYYDMVKVDDALIIPELFVGTWERFYDFIDYRVVIGLTNVQVSINGVNKVATVKSVGTVSVFGAPSTALNIELNGKDYQIIEIYGEDKLTFECEADGLHFTLDKVDSGEVQPPAPDVDIPESYYGSYIGEDDGTSYYIEIDEDGIFVSIDAVESSATDIEYDEDIDWITFKLNGKVYYIMPNSDNEDEIYFLSNDNSIDVTLTIMKPSIPNDCIGTFEGEDKTANKTVKVIAEKDGLEVYFNGVKQTVTIKSIENEYYGASIIVVIDDVEYMFGQYYDEFTFTSYADNGGDLYVTLAKDMTGFVIPNKFHGTFTGTQSGIAITVVITSDEITVKFDEEEYEFIITAYSSTQGFNVIIDGDGYSIFQAGYGDSIDQICLWSDDRVVKATLTKQATSSGETPAPSIDIDAKYYGEFEGEDTVTNITVKVVISADGISVELNDTSVEVVIISAGQEDYYAGGTYLVIVLTLDGKDYSLSEGDSENSFYICSDFDSGNTIQTTIERVSA